MLNLIDYLSFESLNNRGDDFYNQKQNITIQVITYYSYTPVTPLFHLFNQRIKTYANKLKLNVLSQHTQSTAMPSDTSLNKDNENMSTKNSSQQHPVSDRERVNLESHQLIWLDKSINSNQSDSTVTVERLRNVVDYTKLYYNPEECLQHIEQTKDTATFLIGSDELVRIFIPKIHDLENIQAIYIYCSQNEYCQQWISNYSKIKAVYTELNHLLDDLTKDVQKYLQHEKYVAIFSKVVKEGNTTDDSVSWWINFIDLLCYLPYAEDCRYKLISSLKTYYAENTIQIREVAQFESDYKADEALWWYTRPTFLHRQLNNALRQHNSQVMFLFGFIVQDIYRQLKKEHEKLKDNPENPLRLYRGQLMSHIEIKQLKGLLTHRTIVNNSFFSTSDDRSVALLFLNPESKLEDEFQNVLFEIEMDMREMSRPYGCISNLSIMLDEREVLLMIGIQFLVQKNDLLYDENEKLWNVKLKLQSNFNLKFDCESKRKNLKNSISQLTHFIWMALPQDINSIFYELINLFPSEKWILAVKMHCIGNYQEWKVENYSVALSSYEEALKIWDEYKDDDELDYSADIGKIHMDIGDCCQKLTNKHYNHSISCYESALKKATTENEKININCRLAEIYENKMQIGNDKKEENGLKVISYLKTSVQHMKSNSSNTFGIGISLEKIADIYETLLKYDDALTFYESALQFYLEQLDPHPYSIIEISKKIVRIYITQKNDYHSVLKYQLIKHKYTLKKHELKPTDNDQTYINIKKKAIAESYTELADMHLALDEYKFRI